jgi:protein-disulfide isomerase
MFRSRKLLAVAIGMGISLMATPGHARAGQDGSAVVAQVGGHKVTEEELQEKKGAKLLQARYKYYVAERDALDELVEDKLLEMQASREGVSVEELLKRHVAAQVKDPTDDQIRFYYEGLNTDEPYEAVRDKILGSVHQLRLSKARAAYINSLRSEFGVVIELAQPSVRVNVENAFRRGPQNAPVQLVEFADYECAYCQKVYLEVKALEENYGGKLAVVFKDFPLPMHPLAEKASEAARCAGAQGKFWEYHDALFAHKKLQVADLKEQARALQLDPARFDQCLDSGEQAAAVERDAAEGKRLGLTGTPSFFANGHFLSGAISSLRLRETIDQELPAVSPPKQAALLSKPTESARK